MFLFSSKNDKNRATPILTLPYTQIGQPEKYGLFFVCLLLLQAHFYGSVLLTCPQQSVSTGWLSRLIGQFIPSVSPQKWQTCLTCFPWYLSCYCFYLVLPLPGHDLAVGAGDGDAGVEARLVVSLHDVAPERVLVSDGTVVWTLVANTHTHNSKEAGGGAQGIQGSRKNCTSRESVFPLSRLIDPPWKESTRVA